MTASARRVTVVIPTHDRSASVQRTLASLAAQTHPAALLEVVVVANGCADGTAQAIAHGRWPFTLRVLDLCDAGAANARNHGAAEATGDLVLFLDDDIEATPGLIAAHVAAHGDAVDRVVLGASRPVLPANLDFFRIGLRNWWEDLFHEMSRRGHRFTYRDLLTGNVSVARDLFTRSGGFCTELRCREDFELGARLVAMGAQFVFARGALAYHHDASDVQRSFVRVRAEGAADVEIGRRHPALRSTLALARVDRPKDLGRKILRRLSFSAPKLGDALARALARGLGPIERTRSRRRWRALYGALHEYWYWRGVTSELATPEAVIRFLADDPVEPLPEVEIDLAGGLEAAERRLDCERPAGVVLHYRGQELGRIPAEPGVEPLRGIHLRRLLTGRVAVYFAAAGMLDRAAATDSVARTS